MGDPRRLKTKYETPKKLWDAGRIAEESKLVEEFGLKSMRELWKSQAELKKIRRQARILLSKGQAGKARADELISKLARLGIATKDSTTLDDVLAISVNDILARRLETQVFKRGMARTLKQSRQLITHGFISVAGRKLSAPGYLVPVSEENLLSYRKAIDIGDVKKEGESA
ncbi:MAG: 30S ribosomal protein S4 [Candidatus Micrarchaeota archaeon]|nr:30S ribosomal protein S4 [Candidatus Micrarchaeota archaeon]